MIDSGTSISEIGAIVCQALKSAGIDAFLSGGAVVSIYTQNKYESYDLDFVSFDDRSKIKKVMLGLGFNQDRSRLFVHPNSKYFVEFPGSSMMIGDQAIEEFNELNVKGNVLKLLTPTDCVKDRLAAYIHWKDQQGLEQAVLVATDHPVKLKNIQTCCRAEGAEWAFKDFQKRLKQSK